MGLSSSRRRDDYYPPRSTPPPPPPHVHHYASYPAPPPPPPPHQPLHHRPPPPPPPPHAYHHHHHHRPPLTPAYYGPWHPSPAPPPEFVDHLQSRKVKNDVNLKKDSIRLVPDDADPDRCLVAFTFDAVVDGSVIIYYFAKEGKDCSFSSVYPELQTPTRIPFQKGVAQKFVQTSGSGIDLGFFSLDDLSNPSEEVFPLVVYAEGCSSQVESDQPVNSNCTQITLATIEKHKDEFQVKVVKQILWIDGERYELQEFFGIVNSAEAEVPDADDDDMGKECVICLSEPRDTAVFPCRHVCMCSECAKALRLQSNKCPICRQPVEKLVEIKVKIPEL